MSRSLDDFFATWRNASYVTRWLEDQWPDLRPRLVEDDWAQDGIWLWSVPDFAVGKSRILGTSDANLREKHAPVRIINLLTEQKWVTRPAGDPVLVERVGEQLHLRPAREIRFNEAWFETPKGEHFLARLETVHERPFVGLDGATWSAIGDESPRPLDSYSSADFFPALRKVGGAGLI